MGWDYVRSAAHSPSSLNSNGLNDVYESVADSQGKFIGCKESAQRIGRGCELRGSKFNDSNATACRSSIGASSAQQQNQQHAGNVKNIVMQDAVPGINATMRKSICDLHGLGQIPSITKALSRSSSNEDKRCDYR